MKQLKCIIKSFILISLLFSFSGCSGMFGNNDDDGNGGKTPDKGKVGDTVQFLRFNTKNANALGIVDKKGGANASARSAATDAMIVKILEDGSFKSFMSLPEGTQGELKDILMILQSPNPDNDCFYVVLDNYSTLITPVTKSKEYENEDGEIIVETWIENQTLEIGPILCVFADGSYSDFLKKGSEIIYYLTDSVDKAMTIDSKGNLYFLMKELDISSGSTIFNGDLILKYDPSTNEVTKLTIPDSTIYYTKLQVSADGEWFFASVQKKNGSTYTNYLRAIQVSNPESYVNIFYDSNGGNIGDWVFDDDANCLYYVHTDGIHRVPRDSGTFSTQNDKILSLNKSKGIWNYSVNDDALFEQVTNPKPIFSLFTKGSFAPIGELPVYKLNGEVLEDTGAKESNKTKVYTFKNSSSEVQVQEIYDFIVDKASASFIYNSNEPHGYYLDTDPEGKHKYIYKSKLTEKYYISFKKFAEVKGFEALATATQDKTDLEAIKAIFDNKLEDLFASLFLQETTGTPYKTVDPSTTKCSRNFYADILYYKDGENKDKPISTDLFVKNNEYFQDKGFDLNSMFDCESGCNYTWKADFKDGESVNAKKILEKLTSICGEEIDFKLTAFKDDSTYGNLYTDKINEEAIQFLNTQKNLKSLISYFDSTYNSNYGHAKFLNVTCFKKGTEESAYDISNAGEEPLNARLVDRLTTSYQKSLYGVETNKFVELVDETGNDTGTRINMEGSPKLHIVKTLSAENGVYFLNGIDANGSESGKHNIMYYDVVENKLTNLFANIPNGDSLEVISFTGGKDALYFCAVKGFTIMNAKIDIKTGAFSELSSGERLSQVIIVK